MKKIFSHLIGPVFLGLLCACAAQPGVEPDGRDQFVNVHDVVPAVVLDVRYFSDDNFMGRRVDGYLDDVILISKDAAFALVDVQRALNDMELGLKIFDGYRPQKAVDHFVRWAADPDDTLTKTTYYPQLPKDRLFELGYIAKKSGHTRGSTLDLTIISLATGEELNMGSHWDFFGEISHHDSPLVDAAATANRNLLRSVMVQHGFNPYANEWWHYTLAKEPFPDRYFNFDVK